MFCRHESRDRTEPSDSRTVYEHAAAFNKYVSCTQHIYNPLQFLMRKKTWDKLSPAKLEIIQEAANE